MVPWSLTRMAASRLSASNRDEASNHDESRGHDRNDLMRYLHLTGAKPGMDRRRMLCGASSMLSALVAAIFVSFGAANPAMAQNTPAPAAKARGGAPSTPFSGMGANSKDPIKIDADKLDVLDKDSKAIFSGNVVAVQGETTVRCSVMTVFYTPRNSGPGAKPAPTVQPAAANEKGDGNIRRIECKGPVTVVSKTQTATGNDAVFDRVANKVIMTGNVALSDGPNITRGEKLIYDTQTGIANVETNPGGRVQGFFVPGSDDSSKAADGKPVAAKPPKPKTTGAQTPTN
jgi:lipopolysaccharide export system protein LptA